jgi:hypothetical protein
MPNTAPFAFDTGFRSRLGVGLAVSVFAHVGLAMVLARGWWSRLPEPAGMVGALPPPQPEHEVVRPGIAQSRTVTINWLGFEAPTQHAAAPAETDQPALSPETPMPPGPPAEVPSPVQDLAAEVVREPIEPVEPEPATETAAALDEPAEELDAASAKPSEAAAESEPAAMPTPDAEGAGFAAPLLEIVKRTLEAAARAAPEALPQPREGAPAESGPPSSEVSPPSEPGTSGGSPESAPDALPSEKEAGATSREQPIDWAPGRPAAAEGLDITTVDPRWTIATRLSALPRNPVVRLDFGKDGRVRKAEFLPELDTGYRDVDGPLLDALYRWTAKGEALAKLPPGEPEAVVSLKFRIVLIPSRGAVYRAPKGR